MMFDPVRAVLFPVLMMCAMHSVAQTSGPPIPASFPKFFREGHRGARGLMPENTIPSMKRAIDEGANVLEVDVYITRDKQVEIAAAE